MQRIGGILRFIRRGSIYLFFSLVLASSAFPQGDDRILVDRIIGKVDNKIVLKSEMDIRYIQYLNSGPQIGTADLKCEVMESLIIDKLMLAKAELDSVIVEDRMVEDQLDQRMRYFVAQFGSEQKLVEAYGKTIAELKSELRDQVKEQMIAKKMQDGIAGKLKVTPSEVKRFFNKIPIDSLPFFPAEVEVGQIVKYATVSKAQKLTARRRLQELKERIQNGEDFAAIAMAYSDDPGSKKSGGELDFRKRGELVPEYEAAVFKLKPGELSDIVESQFGFHLIELIERRGNEYNSRHILVRPVSSEIDIGEAIDFLDSLRTQILTDSISFEKAARDFSDDPETKNNGGMFFDRNTNLSRIPMEALDPVLFFTIDTLRPGEISNPMPYRTPDNREAARIIYFKLKVPPHQANLVDDFQKIYEAALNEKRAMAIEKWFEKVKDEVYIRVDEEYEYCKILTN